MRIISRAEWGARHAPGAGPAPLPAREVWLHHSVTSAPRADATLEQDAAAVRRLEDIGEQRFRQGISYTFAVPPSGRVLEGHGGATLGAHTRGRNSVARAICLIGDYDTARPTDAQLDAVAALLRHGVERGWWRTAALAGGHRDAPGASTACPGRYAHAAIPEINRRAARPATAPQEDDMELTRQNLDAIRDAVWQGPIDDINHGGRAQAWQHLQRANANAERAAVNSASARDDLAEVLARLGVQVPAGGLDPAVRYQLVPVPPS